MSDFLDTPELSKIEGEVFQENFLGKGKGKKLFKKVGSAIKEKFEQVKDTVKEPEWIPLTPFKPVMQKMLKDRGKDSTGSLPEIGRRFYSEFIKKNYEENFVDPVTASVVVKSIIDFIKNLKAKKEAGDATEKDLEVLNMIENAAMLALDAPDKAFEKATTKELKRTSSPGDETAPGNSGNEQGKSEDESPKSGNMNGILVVVVVAVFFMAFSRS